MTTTLPFAGKTATTGGSAEIRDGWFELDPSGMPDPFLVSLVSDQDHWMYVASNGGLTAGRGSAKLSLFPYYTQDKLIDTAHTTGPLTLVRLLRDDGPGVLWHPFREEPPVLTRRMAKKLDGTQLRFEETNEEAGLVFTYTWGFSRRFGFVRKAVLRNLADTPVRIELLDGWRNICSPGVEPAFQESYSNLLDAYRRCEQLPESPLRLVYLNSIPTDRAEPSESLACTTVWSCGLPAASRPLGEQAIAAFREGRLLPDAREIRGQRASVFDHARFDLEPGGEQTWYFVGEVGQGTADVTRLLTQLGDPQDAALAAALEEDMEENSHRLRARVASGDGLQLTADTRRTSRHFSNVLFNIMRGGIFPRGYAVPMEHFKEHLARSNRPLARECLELLEGLPPEADRGKFLEAANRGPADLLRLATEYLPLSFSRRHGDPSRPWNKFEIRVRDASGRPILAYQGNWRDIFQNWEALAYSYPEYIEGFIARFLNASTADGYNPYRLTSEGFEWEAVDPGEPWSNIGYWGDHQLVYLLRLLEASDRFHPSRLRRALATEAYAYARIPYRIRSFDKILADPRNSIDYDVDMEADILSRVKALGADGKLLAAPDGRILMVSLAEKLIVPLMAKLSNFVPGGGIWMNTQRPEWNDANNALAGYGLSVVTLAYAHRYIQFLERLLAGAEAGSTYTFSAEVAALLEDQAAALLDQEPGQPLGPHERGAFLERLGQPAGRFRDALYRSGLSGEKRRLPGRLLRDYLAGARTWVAASLRENRRPDGLYHSYNLLHPAKDGSVSIEHLSEMLEGQVAVLSSGLPTPTEALEILDALSQSHLYRADQDSYLLYPDRDPPAFLEKNRLPKEAADNSPLLQALAIEPERNIVQRDADGGLCFAPSLRNSADLGAALAALPDAYIKLVEEDGGQLCSLFEKLFAHHAFTGRSGTFFAYEGLGSIYWHMVSKLLLATQEQALSADRSGESPETVQRLRQHYRRILDGLGIWKDPASYGAFPTDAYSHTPKHAGAQQPGMTGQVKEDILSRWGELGVLVEEGCIHFHPVLMDREELLDGERIFQYIDVEGREASLTVPDASLAYTFCQVPVIYTPAAAPCIRLELRGGKHQDFPGDRISREWCREIFSRTGEVEAIRVSFP